MSLFGNESTSLYNRRENLAANIKKGRQVKKTKGRKVPRFAWHQKSENKHSGSHRQHIEGE